MGLGGWQVPEGNTTVLSRTYTDDKTWAAAWMCWSEKLARGVVTGPLCTAARDRGAEMLEVLREGHVSTDNMFAPALLLLRQLGVGGTSYVARWIAGLTLSFLDPWVSQPKPPCDLCSPKEMCVTEGGLVIKEAGAGVLQYTAGMAFVAVAAGRPGAPGSSAIPLQTQRDWTCWAKGQLDSMVGAKTGQAFVTGLDTVLPSDSEITVPKSPRHKGSACGGGPGCAAPSQANRRQLVGALLGGPNRDDSYTDDRNAPGTGPTTSIEHNAGFTAAVMKRTGIMYGSPNAPAVHVTCSPPRTDILYLPRGHILISGSNTTDRLVGVDRQTPYSLVMQDNGNLALLWGPSIFGVVAFNFTGQRYVTYVMWETGTVADRSRGPFKLSWIEPNGGLTVTDAAGVSLWEYWLPDMGDITPAGLELWFSNGYPPYWTSRFVDRDFNVPQICQFLSIQRLQRGALDYAGSRRSYGSEGFPVTHLTSGTTLPAANSTSPRDRLVVFTRDFELILHPDGNLEFIRQRYQYNGTWGISLRQSGSNKLTTPDMAPFMLTFIEPSGQLAVLDKTGAAI
ncbi:hypothetical protein GPECTOR_403g238 [Gonium pectorale]|uniref:cellulase n=1 Tax=Gonium pectorale TaxID=33097 RepID=A0A150FVA1_GONPE|nr:hypothetical protein GPECTOR_403g238 [Gonium pectorale]|eukprot:KXZ41542.1 hypothetical protein GPECTOR_403g238 [Gonium pectorale]